MVAASADRIGGWLRDEEADAEDSSISVPRVPAVGPAVVPGCCVAVVAVGAAELSRTRSRRRRRSRWPGVSAALSLEGTRGARRATLRKRARPTWLIRHAGRCAQPGRSLPAGHISPRKARRSRPPADVTGFGCRYLKALHAETHSGHLAVCAARAILSMKPAPSTIPASLH